MMKEYLRDFLEKQHGSQDRPFVSFFSMKLLRNSEKLAWEKWPGKHMRLIEAWIGKQQASTSLG